MNVLIAPNSMKGSFNAVDFAETIGKAFRKASPVFNIRTVPVADGGDYTGEILSRALHARRITVQVSDPLGRPVEADIGVTGTLAIIEMASASGIRLLGDSEANPEQASSFGTGQLIRRAMELGCTRILLGVGGSATVDGGAGILEALGFRFLDAAGNTIPGRPSFLMEMKDIGIPENLPENTEILVLCDVKNQLLGDNGAARVFAPQKGADPGMVDRLEQGLVHWVSLLERLTGKDIRNMEGSGAAGGVGCGLQMVPDTRLVQGAEYIFDILGMEEHLQWADLVITGEGKIDNQSLAFKAPYALAVRAKKAGKPVIAIAGFHSITDELLFDGVFSIVNKPMSLHEAMSCARELTAETAEQLAGFTVQIHPGLAEMHRRFDSVRKSIQSNTLPEAEDMLASINPDLANYWYYKGMILKRQQKSSDALNAFRQALEIDKGHQPAKAASEMIRNILQFTNPHLLDP